MPKRTDLRSILVVGAGPIVIGQACEFDYSGTQACKALREEGYRVILVNSNPATIMTDPETADVTYIEPVTPGDRRQDHRARAARRAAADHGRADRAQHRHGAGARRHARAAGRRADRRLARGDRQGRGPRPVPRGHAQDRARPAQEPRRALGRGRARGAGRDRAAGDHPALVHAGRHRRRASPTTARSSS